MELVPSDLRTANDLLGPSTKVPDISSPDPIQRELEGCFTLIKVIQDSANKRVIKPGVLKPEEEKEVESFQRRAEILQNKLDNTF